MNNFCWMNKCTKFIEHKWSVQQCISTSEKQKLRGARNIVNSLSRSFQSNENTTKDCEEFKNLHKSIDEQGYKGIQKYIRESTKTACSELWGVNKRIIQRRRWVLIDSWKLKDSSGRHRTSIHGEGRQNLRRGPVSFTRHCSSSDLHSICYLIRHSINGEWMTDSQKAFAE